MPATTKKDFNKDFERRLKNFKFRATKPKITEWERTNIVNDVYDIEMQQRFKSLEERLMFRMEVWIDVCRIETIRDGVLTSGAGKFHSAKRFRKQDGKLTKVRSFSLGKFSAKSVDDVRDIKNTPQEENQHEQKDLPGPLKKKVSKERALNMSPAYSTSDLLERRHREPEQVFNDVTTKYATAPKRKFRFFLFGGSKKDTIKKEKNKRKENSKEDNTDNKNGAENNNLSGNHRVTGTRPSLFDMESLRGSVSEITKLSVNANGYEEHEYDPSQKIKKGSGARYHTVAGIPSQETLFKSPHNDSFRTKKHQVHTPAALQGPLFYNPQRREAELGQI